MIDESEIESIPNIKTVEPEKPKQLTEAYTIDQAIDKIKSILGQDKEYVVSIIEKAFASKKIDQAIYDELHSIVFEYYDDRTDEQSVLNHMQKHIDQIKAELNDPPV
jgi:hypothetical protein